MEDDTKNKYDFLRYLLGEGDAMVCLDARRPGVEVPRKHKKDPSLNLIFNLNFRRPLEIQEEGICVTLSFGGRPHKCVIPFDSVWAIYDPSMKKGQVWEESLPPDIDFADRILNGSPALKIRKPALSSKNGGKQNKPKSPAKRDRSHLRLIK